MTFRVLWHLKVVEDDSVSQELTYTEEKKQSTFHKYPETVTAFFQLHTDIST